MSIADTHRNVIENFNAAASERIKSGAILISPWQIDANQDSLDKGLEDCGCAFAPDDPDDQKKF
jgi:hypothetical protein